MKQTKYYKWVARFLLAAVMIIAYSNQSRLDAQAKEPLNVVNQTYFYNQGWSNETQDGALNKAPAESYVTAVKASLRNQADGMTGTIAYRANLSGKGWTEITENDAENGDASGNMPLEAISMELTGELAGLYDVYYSVFQNGIWTDWSSNGTPAGMEGKGFRVDGISVKVTDKGAQKPEPIKEEPAPAPPQVPVKAGEIDPARPMVALTFDDGPNASVTNRILDSLEANGGRATFFMVGSRVSGKANIGSVKRMVSLGCETGNHTFEHKTITKLDDSSISSQLAKTNQAISDAAGVSTVVMRPPGGAYNAKSMKAVGNAGMSAILWSIDTLDWKTKNKQKTIDAVLNHIKDGDIVLMHDLYSATADAAEVIIPTLTARGYQLVTVSELARYRGGKAAGKVYSRFRP